MKKILIGIIVLIVIVAIVLVVGISNLGPVIKTAVNGYGPKMTGTEVSLRDVSVSLLSAEAKLKDFHLGNPRGFTSPEAMSVGSIFVNVDEKSLMKDTIVVEKIEVVSPVITYEKKRGTDNFKAIMDNVDKAVGGDGSGKTATPAEQSDGKKLLIRNFILRDGKVNLVMTGVSQGNLSASLPDLHLKDIGQKQGGSSPEEAFEEIFNALYANLTSANVTEVLNKGMQALQKGLAGSDEAAAQQLEAAKEKTAKELDAVSDKVKGLFGN